MDLFRAGRTSEAQNIFKQMREPANQYLREDFPTAKDDDFHPIVGMFDGKLEPSTKLDLHFNSAEEWLKNSASVKQRLISFGRNFRQSNVHLVEFKTTCPTFVEFGVPLHDQADVTYQKQLYVRLNKIGRDSFQNYLVFEGAASRVGIENITLDLFGSQILLYTTGRADYRKFDQQCTDFISDLASSELILTVDREHNVALVNYGSARYGGTHTYAAADAYLKGSK